MYCKNCGKKLEDDTKDICISCEAELNNNNPIQYGTKEEKNKDYLISDSEQKNTNTTYVNSEVEHGKSKIAAGLFAIFFGCLGVHNFYLGYTGKAIAQLLITILSFGIFAFVSTIWAFIEGILILSGDINKDAKGNLLRNDL